MGQRSSRKIAESLRVESAAGSHSLWGKRRVEQERESIRRILEEAEQTDRLGDAELGESDGTTLPEVLHTAESRKQLVDEAEKRLRESGKKVISMTELESRPDENQPWCANELQRASGGGQLKPGRGGDVGNYR